MSSHAEPPPLEEDPPTDIRWEPIRALEPLPAEPVYDIEVEGTHNFVANGLLAHNRSLSAAPAPEDTEDEGASNPIGN